MTGDARFRAWGSAISAALAAMGLVKTADTGQIDWASVARPAGSNAVAGFEIWRFNDGLQATLPVFIKLEYGTGATNTGCSWWVTVGMATDGAGALTGAITTRQQTSMGTAITEGQIGLTYISGANSRIVAAGFLGAASSSTLTAMIFGVERTKDNSGADTAEGILTFTGYTGSGGTWRQQVLFPAGAGGQEVTLGIIMPVTGTGASGTQVAVYPQFFTKGVFLNPGMNLFGYVNPNLSALTPTAMTVYGQAHTFLPLGTQCFQSLARTGPAGASGAAPLIRWE